MAATASSRLERCQAWPMAFGSLAPAPPPSVAGASTEASEGRGFSNSKAVSLSSRRTAAPVVPWMRISAGKPVPDQQAVELASVARQPLANSIQPAAMSSTSMPSWATSPAVAETRFGSPRNQSSGLRRKRFGKGGNPDRSRCHRGREPLGHRRDRGTRDGKARGLRGRSWQNPRSL